MHGTGEVCILEGRNKKPGYLNSQRTQSIVAKGYCFNYVIELTTMMGIKELGIRAIVLIT